MKKWLLGWAIILILVVLVGQITKLNFKDCGIAGLKTYEDALSLDCGVSYIIGNEFYGSMVQYEEDYVDTGQVPIVIIGNPTGSIVQKGGWFGQEVKIKKVLKGFDEISEKDTIFVYSVDGFEIYNEKPMYYGGRSLMSKEYEYLIFLQPTNYVTHEASYELVGGFFGYLRLDNDISKPISGEIEIVKYNDIYRYEYFAESQVVLEQIYKIKNKILDEYIK